MLLLSLLFFSCGKSKQPAPVANTDFLSKHQGNNLLASMNPENLLGFQWMNAPAAVRFTDGTLQVTATEKTDFFNNPENNEVSATAPLLFKEMAGDFVLTALVKPDFADIWNACALMVHIDSLNWIKFGFENSDATGKSIVSVVTRGVSDDSNGAVLNDAASIWLRIIRKGNIYAMHWSADGETFKMARLSAMPAAGLVKAGIEAQCPAGKPATHRILFLSIEERTVNDLRSGK